jgi:hypothetical protein
MVLPMADPKYRGLRKEVILPSIEFSEKWETRRKAAGLSMSSWIFETIEASEDYNPVHITDAKDLEAIREENRTLRKELDNAKRDAERATTELFKLRNSIFLNNQGQFQLELRIIEALRNGGTWSDRELLKELEVDPRDVDAIKLVTIQLQHLQDYNLVEESPYGWKWKK